MDKAPEIDLADIQGSIPSFERTLPELTSAYFSPKPDSRTDGLTVGELSDSAAIVELAKEIEQGKHDPYDSLLIAHSGALVFESYYSRGRVNLPHYQASATKAYTSLAVGRAIQLGYLSLQDLHEPVLDFLTEVDQEGLTTGLEKITLHKTLSMRSGLRVSIDKQRDLLSEPERLKGQKLAQAYFAHSEPVTESSQTYHYQSVDPRITMLVLDAVLPGAVKDFIRSELLDKLEIAHYFWRDNVSGVPESAHSTSMTSRDMIKWGLLLKQDGKWQGEQLISGAFLTQATGSVAQPHDEDYDFSQFKYGYYFWGTGLTVGEKEYDAKLAWGGGGQYVIVLDELDLVIAMTAHARGVEDKTLELVEKRILPTFVN
ncbi:MAG: serine hydrolase [Pseudomonadota bacterium]